jgi:hypothetical protein
MKCHQIQMTAVFLMFMSALTSTARSQGVADLSAAGLSPQGTDFSPNSSVSLSADVPAPGRSGIGGGTRTANAFSLSSAAKTKASLDATRGGAGFYALTAKPGSSQPSSMNVSSSAPATIAIHAISAPRPFLGLSRAGVPGSLRPAPRAPSAWNSSLERPIYSFMVRHETGKTASSPLRSSMKGRRTARPRKGTIESILGGHSSP